MPAARSVPPRSSDEDAALVHTFAEVHSPAYVEIVADATAPARTAVLDDAGWTGTRSVVGASVTWPDGDTHLVLLDPEVAEADGPAVDELVAHQPWVVVVRSAGATATPPDAGVVATLLAAGYVAGPSTGASVRLVAPQRTDLLARLDRTPDDGPSDELAALRREVADLTADLERWRTVALEAWSEAVASPARAASDEVVAMQRTLSWRVTRPLRAVRRFVPVGLGRS